MPNSKNQESSQLTFDELLQKLDEEPDKLHQLPISADDIGGELLAVLTKGLYTNPLDCIREYVQNAVDASAKTVTINITGNSVSIFDDGNGMSLEDLLRARQFGLSPKFIGENVGFRGIGIYSGFDLCRRLRITSKRANDSRLHVLVFEFAEMKAQLEGERQNKTIQTGEKTSTPHQTTKSDVDEEQDIPHATQSQKTSLLTLLSQHTYIKREASELPDDLSFTQVELQDINDFHIRQLKNRPELRRYLLQNLPIDFAETYAEADGSPGFDGFEYRDEINRHLLTNVAGYAPITILLQADDIEDEVVAKYAGVKVQAPTFGFITSGSKQVAYYWAALNHKGDRIDLDIPPAERPKYEGFVYKVKGFTVGNRQKLRSMFATRDVLYTWYTGEIYVLDPNVVPNAERNDFESGAAKEALELAIAQKLDKELKPAALKFQEQGRAKDVLVKHKRDYHNITEQLAGNPLVAGVKAFENNLDIYSQLVKIVNDLRNQKKHLSGQIKQEADDLQKQAENLQKQLIKDVNKPTPQTDRQKQAARDEHIEDSPSLFNMPRSVQPTRSDADNSTTKPSARTSSEATQIQRTVPQLLQEAGWEPDPQTMALAEIFQSCLEEVLSVRHPIYRDLIDFFELRLINESGD